MRDSLDINAKRDRIIGTIAVVVSILLFAALLTVLIVRKNNIHAEELSASEDAQTIQQVSGEELFPELYGDESGVGEDNTDAGIGAEDEQLLPENTYLLPERDTVTFTFAGDVLLDENYAVMSTYRANGSVLENCIDPELLEIMQGSDVFMINNEFPYTDRGTPLANKTFTFRADPANVQILKDMGVDIVSLDRKSVV